MDFNERTSHPRMMKNPLKRSNDENCQRAWKRLRTRGQNLNAWIFKIIEGLTRTSSNLSDSFTPCQTATNSQFSREQHSHVWKNDVLIGCYYLYSHYRLTNSVHNCIFRTFHRLRQKKHDQHLDNGDLLLLLKLLRHLLAITVIGHVID